MSHTQKRCSKGLFIWAGLAGLIREIRGPGAIFYFGALIFPPKIFSLDIKKGSKKFSEQRPVKLRFKKNSGKNSCRNMGKTNFFGPINVLRFSLLILQILVPPNLNWGSRANCPPPPLKGTAGWPSKPDFPSLKIAFFKIKTNIGLAG